MDPKSLYDLNNAVTIKRADKIRVDEEEKKDQEAKEVPVVHPENTHSDSLSSLERQTDLDCKKCWLTCKDQCFRVCRRLCLVCAGFVIAWLTDRTSGCVET